MLGDAYYWAPTDWAAQRSAQNFSASVVEPDVKIQLRPSETSILSADYDGVVDRESQGGHTLSVRMTRKCPTGGT